MYKAIITNLSFFISIDVNYFLYNKDESNGSTVNINKNPGVPSGVNSANPPQAPGGPATQNSAPPPSWAAAAGKGLPNNDNPSSSGPGPAGAGASQNTTSKHLESLQSVREALFSQDGWGGDNVKQDNAWDADGKNSNPTASAQDTSQVSYNIIAKLNSYVLNKCPFTFCK